MSSARPVRRFNAPRAYSRPAFRRPKSLEAPLALSHPFRGLPRRPRKAPPTRRSAWRTLLPLLDFSALRHIRGAVIPFAVRGSSRRRVPSPGFGYPPLGVHHRPYRRVERRSVLGLLPSRRSPRRGRQPFREPCPLGVAAASPHRGVRRDTADFRASISRRARSGIGHRVPKNPKNPTVDAFLGFTPPELSPHPFGHALWSRCRPSHPFGGATSRPARVSGLREADGSAWSVSGLPALLGFSTFRPSRRSVRRVGGRAHGFTSREMPGVYGTARS